MSKKQEAGPEKSESSSSFTMNVGHPDIPEGRYMTMARHAVEHLFLLCKDEGEGYTVGHFCIGEELKQAGFQKSIPQFTFLLYELGVVKRLRKSGKERVFRYFVLNPEQFNSRVTEEVVGLALEGVQKRMSRSTELGKLRKCVEDVPAQKSSGLSEDHVAAMAEMVATIEQQIDEIAQCNLRIAELEQRPTTTAEATAEALIARFQKTKST